MSLSKSGSKYSWVKNSSLTLVLLFIFLVAIVGQAVEGFKSHNEQRTLEGVPPIPTISAYITTPHFISSVFENWESEFLQMAIFVFASACLVQKGSSESNPPKEEESLQGEKINVPLVNPPYFSSSPVLRKFYENSLTLSLLVLFIISFVMHGYGSWGLINYEKTHYGLPTISFLETFVNEDFWFESFQNWQSEFLSMAVIGVLSIFLRQKDSPQSKEVDAPHWKTGSA